MKGVKIAFTGPECSGKTTLSDWTSVHFDANLVSEYARAYLSSDSNYKINDLEKIAQEQYNQNTIENGLTILDTEMLVMRIWCEEKFGFCSPLIKRLYNKQKVDLYFLCKPDFKWEPDVLRENPNDRNRLFEHYVTNLSQLDVPFIILSGNLVDRKAMVKAELKKVLV